MVMGYWEEPNLKWGWAMGGHKCTSILEIIILQVLMARTNPFIDLTLVPVNLEGWNTFYVLGFCYY